MGCIARLGCLVLLVILAICAWFTRDRWMPKSGSTATAVATAPVWEPLTSEAGVRGRRAVETMSNSSGPVFTNLHAAELASYVFQSLAKTIPASADSAQAAVIGDALYVSAIVPIKDLAGSGALGPLGGLLNSKEKVTLGGAFRIVRPGLGEFQVREITLRDFRIPSGAIPKLVQQLTHGKVPEGIAPDALPFPTPASLGDVRIANRKITLYKTIPGSAP